MRQADCARHSKSLIPLKKIPLLTMTDTAKKQPDTVTQGAASSPGNYRQRAVAELSQPAPAPRENETKKERREREGREAVAELKNRARQANAVVLAARERFAVEEEQQKKLGRPVIWEYTEETVGKVLQHVEQAIPLADYSEFPGAMERPGACTLAGIPYRAFRRWMEEREDLRALLARARQFAADTLAERHLHLAQVALETPRMSDAVRVAADILKWQAAIRNRQVYGDEVRRIEQGNQQITINIGTDAVKPARVIEAETVPVLSQSLAQVPDAKG